MKVLMIGPARSVHGGVSAVVNNFYKAGLGEKVELTYLATMVDGSKLRKLWQAGFAYLQFLLKLPACELLHVNMAADASFYRKKFFIDTAHLFRKKIIIHEHGGDFQGFYYEKSSRKAQQRIRKTLGYADLFLVLSKSWEQFFQELVPKERIRILENAVELPTEKKQDYSSHKAVFLGRLCKEKGIGELLTAVPVIRKEIPDFQLVLGGLWEPGNEELKKRAEELSEAVFCPGWISQEQRNSMFQECSLFVLPTWFEGQPISLLEAMAAGMCVAASQVGGIPQIMGEDEACGVYLKPKDAEDLADKLILLLKDETRRRKLGESARAKIEKEYEIGRKVTQLVTYYDEVWERWKNTK